MCVCVCVPVPWPVATYPVNLYASAIKLDALLTMFRRQRTRDGVPTMVAPVRGRFSAFPVGSALTMIPALALVFFRMRGVLIPCRSLPRPSPERNTHTHTGRCCEGKPPFCWLGGIGKHTYTVGSLTPASAVGYMRAFQTRARRTHNAHNKRCVHTYLLSSPSS